MSEMEKYSEEEDDRTLRIVWMGLANKSTRQLADETGLSPERIHAIKVEAFSSIDDLTLQQKRHRLMVELEALAEDARDRARNTDDEFYSGMMNSAVSAMKAVLVELARSSKGEDEKIERLNRLRTRELIRLIDGTVKKSIDEISEKFNLDKSELMNIFQNRLVEQAREMEESGL